MSKDISNLKDELLRHRHNDLAFVLGNGLNIYAMGNNSWSWEKLLQDTWTGLIGDRVTDTDGMSMTEMYNLIELKTTPDRAKQIKNMIVNPLENGLPTDKHRQMQQYLENWNVPVMTTNFDHMLEEGYERKTLNHPKRNPYHAMSPYYPWDRYYSYKEIENPSRDYAVWHINGFIEFKSSIKLSFSEYIAQASYSRKYLHKHSMDDFDKKHINYWGGYNTWLHTIFNCSLCIIGLSLNEDETFLRWLLIERQKYYKKNPDRVHKGWYIYKENPLKTMPKGKDLYLKGVGFQPISVDKYEDIYEDLLRM